MAKPDDPANEAQLKQLIGLYQKGLLSKENLQAALTGMGMNSDEVEAVFNQIQQQVRHQTNIAGDVKGHALSGRFSRPCCCRRWGRS